MHFPFEQLAHDGQDVGECAAQAREFGHDERIAFVHVPYERSELAFVPSFAAADRFLDPTVDVEVVAVCKFRDFVLLILKCLFFCSDP